MTPHQNAPWIVVFSGYSAVLFTAAIFGFFYAWVCSTMWGLDSTSPLTAVNAMQAMNSSIRNAVFAPGFFGPGPVCLIAAALCWRFANRFAVILFLAAALTYIVGGNLLTFIYLIPMNESLALEAPASAEQAQVIWEAYSPLWQTYNLIRTLFCAISLIFAAIGLRHI